MSERLIQDIHAAISRRDWNAVETAANAIRDDEHSTRRILAGTDIGSLPIDMSTSKMAEKRMAELSAIIEDRARFPDRPDVIGRMIEANIGNLKACKQSAEDHANRAIDRAIKAESENAVLFSSARRQAFGEVAQKAREYAAHYPEASDGRNTFIIFAEWAEEQP